MVESVHSASECDAKRDVKRDDMDEGKYQRKRQESSRNAPRRARRGKPIGGSIRHARDVTMNA